MTVLALSPHLDDAAFSAGATLAVFAEAPHATADRRSAWAHEASERWQLPLEGCRKYLLDECVYDVGADLASSLTSFRNAAAGLGLCEADLDPTPIELAPQR